MCVSIFDKFYAGGFVVCSRINARRASGNGREGARECVKVRDREAVEKQRNLENRERERVREHPDIMPRGRVPFAK